MKQDGNIKNKLDRLKHVLDTFGADSTRWPVADRTALEAHAGTNKSAARLVNEAKALARVMNAAPELHASAALREQIVAAALDDPGREVTVVPFASARRQVFSSQRTASMWPAAALAASFAFGLYMGVSGFGGAAVESVFQVAMTETSGNDAGSISWLVESAGGDEEGLL